MTQKLTRRGPEFYRYLWRLSLPMILQNLITFSLGLIDTFMVSRLGNTQMAAVTTANQHRLWRTERFGDYRQSVLG